jgi:hypothetical protein
LKHPVSIDNGLFVGNLSKTASLQQRAWCSGQRGHLNRVNIGLGERGTRASEQPLFDEARVPTGGIALALKTKKWKASILGCALSAALLGALTCASAAATPQINADEKSKVTGTIVSRSGDL